MAPNEQSSIDQPALAEFGAILRGDLVQPGDGSYDDRRKVWNASIDRYPALSVRCAGVADVIEAVHFARTHQLLLAVRGGGHSGSWPVGVPSRRPRAHDGRQGGVGGLR